jgi:hypothetical protein
MEFGDAHQIISLYYALSIAILDCKISSLPKGKESLTKIYIPSTKPEDWKSLLADPKKQWRKGYSAKGENKWDVCDFIRFVLLAGPGLGRCNHSPIRQRSKLRVIHRSFDLYEYCYLFLCID